MEKNNNKSLFVLYVFCAFIIISAYLIFPGLAITQANAATSHVYSGDSIQDAIDAASGGDEIIVHAGTYHELIKFDGTKTLTVSTTEAAVIDGDLDSDTFGDGTVVTFTGGDTSTLSGFTIQTGDAANSHNSGGGVFCWESSPTLIDCQITGNYACEDGGGVFSSKDSSPSLTNCDITDNNADGNGGGVYSYLRGSITVTGGSVIGNTAGEKGGGIYFDSETTSPAVTRCVIAVNTAEDGGGIFSKNSSPLLVNCNVTDNTANDDGGGIYLKDSSITMTNSTVSNNGATISGGGIFFSAAPDVSQADLINAILWGNIAVSAGNDAFVDAGSTLNADYSDYSETGIGGTGTINKTACIDTDPLFVDDTNIDPLARDYHLTSESPCINAASDDTLTYPTIPDDDIDSDSRPIGSEYDIGSDESWGLFYIDADGDGYGDSEDTGTVFDKNPGGYSQDNTDCDDGNAAVNPGAVEVCNGIDDNCDGTVDEGFDTDGDGYTSCQGDCDDDDADTYPGAKELCDGIDNDCDGVIHTFEIDDDSDGYSECQGDCNDSNADINPGKAEECNGIDDDCNGTVDEGFDTDGDGYTLCADDCDDDDANTYPGATELCDGIDNDCDGVVPTDEIDDDGDGYSECQGDCDDGNADINPGKAEECNGIDDDCDGVVPTDEIDDDGDGYSECQGDCDDAAVKINPDQIEDCNGVDDNCNGIVDEGFDADGDGYSTCQGDCDDDDANTYPGAIEIYDKKDNNCNGLVDDFYGDSWWCFIATAAYEDNGEPSFTDIVIDSLRKIFK